MGEWWRDFYDLRYASLALEEGPVDETADFILRALELEPGQRLLDQCCGVGRFSQALAVRGLEVIGVDLMDAYIERARKRAETAGTSGMERLTFVAADAFRYVPERPVHAVINWGTSFGYTHDDGQNAQMLERARDALLPGGRFALEYYNTPALLRGFQRNIVSRLASEAGEILVIRSSTPRLAEGILEASWTYVMPDGERRVVSGDTRLYMPHELRRLVVDAGFEEVRLIGDLDGSPLSMDSPRCIVLGTAAQDREGSDGRHV